MPSGSQRARATDIATEAGDQHHHQQYDTGDEQPRRHLLPGGQRHLEGDGGGNDADAEEDRMADQNTPAGGR